MAGISKLLLEIIGKDKASGPIKQVKGSLGGLGDVSKGMGKALDLLAVGGFAFAGSQAVKAMWDLGQLGAQTQQLRSSFEEMARQTGGSADAMLSAIQRATSGTVSEYDAMLAANRGMMLGLGANADQWEKLVEVARFRAQAMGLSVTQALGDITTGIGRESRMILDNLGIILDLDSVMTQYAASVGKTTEQLDSFERKQAIMASVISTGQAQIAAAGGVADTYATQMERMTAAMDDAKRAAGEALAPAIADLASMFAEGMQQMAGSFEIWRAALSGDISFGEAIRADMEATRIATEQGQAAANAYRASVIETGARLQDFAQGIIALAEADKGASAAHEQFRLAVAQSGSALGAVTGQLAKATSETDALADSTYNLASALWEASGAARSASDVYEYRRSQISNEGMISDLEQIKTLNEEIPTIIATGAKEAEQAWDSYYDNQKQRLDELRSAVTAALQPTQVTQLDMDLSATGDYVEKWDENARRLDAIAQRGFAELQQHADWASILKIPENLLTGSEQALKNWASNAADAVRSLERPDLINLDAAVAAVEQYMQREAAKEMTIDLVVGEIAARGGLSMEDARRQVMQAYGMEEEMPVPVTLQLAPGAQEGLFAETGGALPVPIQLQLMEGGGVEEAAAGLMTGLMDAFAIAAAAGDFRLMLAQMLGLDQVSGTEVGAQLLLGITTAIQGSMIGAVLADRIAADINANKAKLIRDGVAAWNHIETGIVDAIFRTNIGGALGELILRLVAQAVGALGGGEGAGEGGGYTGGAGEP